MCASRLCLCQLCWCMCQCVLHTCVCASLACARASVCFMLVLVLLSWCLCQCWCLRSSASTTCKQMLVLAYQCVLHARVHACAWNLSVLVLSARASVLELPPPPKLSLYGIPLQIKRRITDYFCAYDFNCEQALKVLVQFFFLQAKTRGGPRGGPR